MLTPSVVFAYWMRGSMARPCYTIGRRVAKGEDRRQSYAASRVSNTNNTVVCVDAAALGSKGSRSVLPAQLLRRDRKGGKRLVLVAQDGADTALTSQPLGSGTTHHLDTCLCVQGGAHSGFGQVVGRAYGLLT